jgi:hypothetical protein
LLLAGLIPETIATNSTSVLKIVHEPFSLVFVALFYGTADLVIREAIIRRPLGLASMVLLGVAFGFVNEGVVAGTWYTVRPDGYAFVHGIDWGWAIALTIFHLFVSVLIPVYLIDSVVPSIAGVSLLKRRGIIICSALFVGFSALVVLTPTYRLQRLIVLLVALALALIAVRLPPARLAPRSRRPAPGLWRLRVLGFLAMLLYFLGIYLLPAVFAGPNRAHTTDLRPALVANVILLALSGWALAMGQGWSSRAGWSPRQRLALISGALTFSLLASFAPWLIATWEPLATVPSFLLLVALAWRARAADHRISAETAIPKPA